MYYTLKLLDKTLNFHSFEHAFSALKEYFEDASNNLAIRKIYPKYTEHDWDSDLYDMESGIYRLRLWKLSKQGFLYQPQDVLTIYPHEDLIFED